MAATAMAEEAKSGPKFEFHGFVGGSLFAQDAIFAGGYGQQAINGVSKQPNTDKVIFGGDARQTRLNFSLAGPKVFGGAVPKGVFEFDFFSAANTATFVTGVTTTTTPATGPVTRVTTTTTSTSLVAGTIAVLPRLRLSYAELNWGETIFRMGQENDLIGGSFAPTSVGHIPQSYAYGAGYLSTRHIMAEVFETVPAGDMKAELALQVQAPIGGTADPFSGLNTAESSGIPGFEARARIFMPKLADVYVVGHWSRRDRNGQDNTDTATFSSGAFGNKQDIVAGSAGVKFTPGPLTIQGQGYVGKNLQEFTGGLGQTVANNKGDAHEYGAWGQVGLNVTPEFSAWAFVGTERFTNYRDAAATFGANARLANVTFAGMLRYMDGGYALGLEGLHMRTTFASVQAASAKAAPNGVLDGNQLMLSGMYFF
jgi:hypothetical protein